MSNPTTEPQPESELQPKAERKRVFGADILWSIAFIGVSIAYIILTFQHEDDGRRKIDSRGGQFIASLFTSYVVVGSSLCTHDVLNRVQKPEWADVGSLFMATFTTIFMFGINNP